MSMLRPSEAPLARPARYEALLRGLSYRQTIALVTVAAALVRLLFLARQPLGLDEDFTAAAIRLSVPDMLSVVAHDSAPPLHYLLTALVTELVPGLFGLRLVSAVAGIALVPLIASLGRRIAGDPGGILAACVAAFIPAAVVASETARGYALAGMLCVAAFVALWHVLERPSPLGWLAYFGAVAAAFWTSYFAAFAVVGLAAAGLVIVAPLGRREASRRLAAAAVLTAAAALTLAPWLAFAQAQFGHASAPFWVEPLGPAMLGGTFGQFFAGPEAPPFVPLHLPLVAAEYLAVAAGTLAAVVLAVRWSRMSRGSRRSALVCAIGGGGGVVTMAALSIWRPLLDARYAGVMWLPLYALLGAGLVLLPRRHATLVLAALALPGLALSTAVTQRDTQALVPVVEAKIGPHDLVAAEPSEYLVLLADGSPQLLTRLHVLAPDDLPWYLGTAVYPPRTVLRSVPSNVVANGGRILYVGGPDDAPRTPLPSGYAQAERSCVVGACLTVFAPSR